MLVEFIYITEVVKYILFFKYILREDIQRIWISLMGFIIYNIVIQFNVPVGFTAVCIVAISLLCMVKNYRLKLYGIMIISIVLLDCVAEIIIILVKGMAEYFWNVSLTKIEYYFITNLVLIIIILFLIFGLKDRKRGRNYISVNIVYSILGVVVFLLAFTVGLLEYLTDYIEAGFLLKLIDIFSVITFFCILVLLVIVLYIYNINECLKQSFEKEKLMKEAQQVYYKTLLEKEDETREYRHDISNHILCLKEMVASKEITKVQNYIDSMGKQFTKINNKVYDMGNMVFNIMLNYYIGSLRKETKIYILGRIENEIAAADFVLCTVFSNVIKNAIEEINHNEIQNPILYIIVDNGKSNVKIEIRNTSLEKKIKNGLVKTKKTDTKNHGIGLKKVKTAIEECGGIYEISYEEGIFITKLYLPFVVSGEKK